MQVPSLDNFVSSSHVTAPQRDTSRVSFGDDVLPVSSSVRSPVVGATALVKQEPVSQVSSTPADVVVDTAALPLSSLTAHARQTAADTASAALESTRIAKVQRAYVMLNPKKITAVASIPFSSVLQPDAAYQELIRTVKLALNDILMMSDPDSLGVENPVYVKGWIQPLQKIVTAAVTPDLPCTSDLILALSDYFQQIRRRLDDGASGPEAFKQFLRLLADHFDTGDSQTGFLRLQQFGVSTGTSFAVYLRAFRLLVASVSGSERTLAPSTSMILEIVRSSVMKQYPMLSPLLYPGALATAVTPFVSVSAMWEAFSPLSTNQTPALAGDDYFSLPSTQGSSQPRRTNRSTSFSNQRGSGSQHDPIVMPVADKTYDPFSSNYACWPAHEDDWAVVYSVTSNFKSLGDDPVLYSALLTQDQRNRAFRDHRGKCLNCSEPDHSMKHCRAHFTNSSGLLNPEIGLLRDNSDAWRRWQNRLRSTRLSDHSGGSSNSKGGYRRKSGNRYSNNRRRGDNRNSHTSGNNNTQQSTALALHNQQGGTSHSNSGTIVPQNPNSRQPGNFSSGAPDGSQHRG